MSYFGVYHSRYPYLEDCSQVTRHAHTHRDTHSHNIPRTPNQCCFHVLLLPFTLFHCLGSEEIQLWLSRSNILSLENLEVVPRNSYLKSLMDK